jgi:ABC-type multidrug transport system ATPase subunit
MIEIEGLRKAYGEKVVLSVEQWSLAASNCVLEGENGAGKTTLLLILAGLEHPTRGVVRINGHPTGSRGARGVVSFAPDQPALFDDLTVADQMAYVARLHGLDAPFEVAGELVEAFDADELLGRFPRGMSKGQRQKAGLLVATARPFEVLLLDEPTTGLDATSRAGLIDVLKKVAERDRIILSSTHDDDLIREADRVVRVADGSLRAGGRKKARKKRPEPA